jgi:hypothetical protein
LGSLPTFGFSNRLEKFVRIEDEFSQPDLEKSLMENLKIWPGSFFSGKIRFRSVFTCILKKIFENTLVDKLL